MNPYFKPEMITPKLLKACGDQVNKYFYGPMDDKCEFCRAMPDSAEDGEVDCRRCPLSDGELVDACCEDKTFIPPANRRGATKKQLLARVNRLIEILDEHGITIIDEEVE